MPFADGYSLDEARLLMTLCTLTYLDGSALPGETVQAQATRMRRDINAALANSSQPNWQVTWGPGLSDDRANMLFVASDGNSDQQAVVVRGTDWSFILDWVQDLAVVLPLQAFTNTLPGIPANNPRIAAGTNVGLSELERVQGATPGGTQLDVVSFLRTAGQSAEIFVSGHSLGGCLASVLAPTLAFQLGSGSNFKVYTFAAPSAGDQAFADYYNRLFTNPVTGKSTAYRIYNNLDVVPNSWASLTVIETYYVPQPKCTEEIKLVVQTASNAVGNQYVQVGTPANGSSIELPGSVVVEPTAGFDPLGDAIFFREVQDQHETSMYQRLLSSPEVLSPGVGKLRAMRRK